MNEIEEIKEKRMKFLKLLYNSSDCNPNKWFDITEIGTKLGYDNYMTRSIVNYLNNAGLISLETEKIIVITHKGICEVEKTLSNKSNVKKSHFDSGILIERVTGNVTLIGNMNNSKFTQTISGNIQNSPEDSIQEIKKIIQSLNANIDKFCLDKELYADFQAYTKTLEAQISASKPKKSIIKESLSSIREILEGAAGSIIASEIISQISTFLSKV